MIDGKDEENQLLSLDYLQEYLPFNPPGQKIKEEDFLKAVLVYTTKKFSLIPDLLTIFNLKDVIKFLTVFSGQTLVVPEHGTISDNFRDIHIYFSIELLPTTDEIKRLAQLFNLAPQTIRLIVEKVATMLDKPNPLKNKNIE
jgi:hypothetical protein